MGIKKKIICKKGPEAKGPYSPCIKTCENVYISGQLPLDPETGKMYVPKGMIENELRMILKNAEDITGVQIEQVKSEQGQTEIMLQDRKE